MEGIMAITTMDNGWVSDSFSFDSPYGVFGDSLCMPQEQYDALTADEIAAMKQARFDNWVAIIETPADPVA